MTRSAESPIWDVHDLRRTARLRNKYLCARLASIQRRSFWMEIGLAATASGSAIAGLAFWDTDPGRRIWQTLMIVSAILAVAKPLLRFTDVTQRLGELVASYSALEHDLQKIEIKARQRGAYDMELQGVFNELLERMDSIVIKPSEFGENKKLKARCEEEVRRELPSDHFYVPPQ